MGLQSYLKIGYPLSVSIYLGGFCCFRYRLIGDWVMHA